MTTKRAAVKRQKQKSQNQNNIEREFLSVEQVCELYGVSQSTVYRSLKDKTLPAKKIRHLWRIRKEDADQWSEKVPAN